MASPSVSQAVCHAATTASVVWLLALDFIFTRCVSPCPQNFNIGCCAIEKSLRLIADRRVRFFTFMFLSTLVLRQGGNLSNPIQASENIVILQTNECTFSVNSSSHLLTCHFLSWMSHLFATGADYKKRSRGLASQLLSWTS